VPTADSMTIKSKNGILQALTVSSDLSTYLGAAREILQSEFVRDV